MTKKQELLRHYAEGYKQGRFDAAADAALAEPSDTDVAGLIKWYEGCIFELRKAIDAGEFGDDGKYFEHRIEKWKQTIKILRQYQKPTDEAVAEAIEFWEKIKRQSIRCIKQSQNGKSYQVNLLPTLDNAYALDLAITALRQMRTEPDCSTAEWQGGYCLGYGKSDTDDEPCEVCKACPKQASYEEG